MKSPTIGSWQKQNVHSDGSDCREQMLISRGRSHGFCCITGLSLSLSSDVRRIGSDIYVAADLIPESMQKGGEQFIQELIANELEITRLTKNIEYLVDEITTLERELESDRVDLARARLTRKGYRT